MDEQDELPLPPLIPAVAGAASVMQQHTLSQPGPMDRLPDVTETYYANFAMAPQQLSYFSEWAYLQYSYVGVMVFTFYLQVLLMSVYTNGGLTILGFFIATLWSILTAGMYASWG